MAFTIITVVTNLAKQKLARAIVEGVSFEVKTFSVGNGGHDLLDPTIALPPDATLTTCPSLTFGPKAIAARVVVNYFTPLFSCFLETDEAVGQLSNLCLYGEVNYPLTHPEYGIPFLFSVGNFPLRVKLDVEEITFSVSIIF